ncbi:MAG: carbon-nitrogen hydrolase family protein [Ancylobacter novellus]|uniref:Carbon-nitrogen hydrolase family protein n=1 Tax=Ancylobacter novellus TaxID=921 RepID=A0A2W5R0T1_ANCNO|nr:MAG: carbon-nitrogen hydrolase family protein [Ancylobacter novellus]
MSGRLLAAGVPIGPAGRDPVPLWAEAEAGIRAAAGAGAALVVLPELFAQPYVAGEPPADWAHLAEAVDGPTTTRMRAAAMAHGVAVLFGLALRGDAGLPLNAALLARPDGQVETLATKIHLPPAGSEAYGEEHHFSPGAAIVGCIAVGGFNVAALICYDRRFPECWRTAAAAGADLVAVLVGGPAQGDPAGLYAAELQASARANAVYALAAARYGTETVTGRPVRHDGATLGFDPDGAAITAGSGPLLVAVERDRLTRARDNNATARRLRLPSLSVKEASWLN